MEELLATLGIGTIILIIISILPYIAIIGTWLQLQKLNKQVKKTNDLLLELGNMLEHRTRYK